MIVYNVIFLCFCLFLFCGCSSKLSSSPLNPVVLDKSAIVADQKVLSGTGRVLFNQPLFGLFSKEFYFINVDLIAEDSFFLLHSHFTGFAKEDGIKVFFKRVKTTLTIEVATPFYPPQILYTKEDFFFKNQNLSLYIELQNGTTNQVNLKIWSHYLNPTGYLKTPADFFSDKNLIADSHNRFFYSKGLGLLWGVELYKAQLKEVERRPVEP